MSRYRRAFVPGGTFFFTVNLADRRSALLTEKIDLLRAAYRKTLQDLPFVTVAICVLPDHLHAVWSLPPGDSDYSTRWQRIKSAFSKEIPAPVQRSESKQRKREKGIWQRRFWEHGGQHLRDRCQVFHRIVAESGIEPNWRGAASMSSRS